MMATYLKKSLLPLLCLSILTVATLTATAAERIDDHRKYELFTEQLRPMLSPVIADFIERYLYERMNLDADSGEAQRKMNFDEVRCSFPLQNAELEKLKTADGLSVLIDKGKVYTVSWYAGEDIIGEMTFPISYNLIAFTDQVKSYKDLVARMRHSAQSNDNSVPTFVGTEPAPSSASFKRQGAEFYLGHLEANTYLDSITGRPLWTAHYPAESLANLFVYERPVADVMVSVASVAYDGTTEEVEIPLHKLREIMNESGCSPYFGVSEIDPATGEIEALVVYHNADLAYLHKMEVSFNPDKVWGKEGIPHLSIRLMPYIKLHNLTNLWGERNRL